jgi:hypothetical protein
MNGNWLDQVLWMVLLKNYLDIAVFRVLCTFVRKHKTGVRTQFLLILAETVF